jgi:hypothetical protein
MNFRNVDEYVSVLPERHLVIAEKLRQLIKEAAPNLTESIKWNLPCYASGKNICYFVAQRNSLNFGFYDATTLADPEKLLEGTGKKMRHVKIRSIESMPEDALRNLIKQVATV